MCLSRSLALLGRRQSSAGLPRPAKLFQLIVDFLLRTGGHQRGQGVENLQPPLDFAFAQASDAPMIGRHSLTDDLALRLGQDFGGILDFVNGLRVQRERDFAGCHTSNILRPYGRVRLTTYLIGFGLESLAVCHVRGRGQTDSTGVERHRLTLKLKRCCRKRYAIEPPPGNLPPSSQPSRSTLAGPHGRPARDREWKVSRARRAWSAQCGCLVARNPPTQALERPNHFARAKQRESGH